MSQANEETVNVIVTQRPNRVYAVVKDTLHVGKWSTVNPGENGVTAIKEGSNTRLLHAAMNLWSGREYFTTTVSELKKYSGGYGVDI